MYAIRSYYALGVGETFQAGTHTVLYPVEKLVGGHQVGTDLVYQSYNFV